MYSYEIRASLEKEFFKLAKKKPQQLSSIGKKIKEIIACENVDHYKNLKSPMQHLKRVHIDNRSFVLVFYKHTILISNASYLNTFTVSSAS